MSPAGHFIHLICFEATGTKFCKQKLTNASEKRRKKETTTRFCADEGGRGNLRKTELQWIMWGILALSGHMTLSFENHSKLTDLLDKLNDY